MKIVSRIDSNDRKIWIAGMEFYPVGSGHITFQGCFPIDDRYHDLSGPGCGAFAHHNIIPILDTLIDHGECGKNYRSGAVGSPG